MVRAVVTFWTLTLLVGSAYADRADTLIKRLRSSRVKTRLSAALVLGKRKDVKSLQALTKTLKKDSNPLVRLAATAGLGTMLPQMPPSASSKKAIAVLRRTRQKDSSPKVRQRAAKVLETLRPNKTKEEPIRSLLVRVKKPSGEITPAIQKSIAAKLSNLFARQRRIAVGSDVLPIGARRFVVSSRITFSPSPPSKSILAVNCSASVRASPGSKNGERWRARESAIATAAAQAMGPQTKEGMRQSKSQCALAAVEAAASRQIIPFLKKQLL